MLRQIEQSFAVHFAYPVVFARSVWRRDSMVLRDIVRRAGPHPHKALLVIDSGVANAMPGLMGRAIDYAREHADTLRWVCPPLVLPGGEACKSAPTHLDAVHRLVHEHGLCRQSFVIVIGGGAVLDTVGYATSTAHRGLRLIRMPTTVLAQSDVGVGVKNGVNVLDRKNFLGTFAPPFAVINDFDFLSTLQPRDLRAGMAEAVKVAAIQDAEFLGWLHAERDRLAAFDPARLEHLIIRCAELHIEHIRSGDPFEFGSTRPLDFGHWSAHRLEQMTAGGVRHGEAVAIGIALDSLYAARAGLLTEHELGLVIETLAAFGLALYHPAIEAMDVSRALQEFQEHIGGELCITVPAGLGRKKELHEIDLDLMRLCIRTLPELPLRSGCNYPGVVPCRNPPAP